MTQVSDRPKVFNVSTGRERVYEVHIKVSYQFGKFSFRDDSLMAKVIKENGGWRRDQFPIFEAYVDGREAAEDTIIHQGQGADKQKKKPGRKKSKRVSIIKSHEKLCNKVKTIQPFMQMASDGYHWHYPESFHPKYQQFLRELKQLKQEQTDRLLRYYDDAEALLRQRLTSVLKVANRMDQLEFYMSKFPTREELQNCFTLVERKPEPIRKALEVAEADPIWAESLRQKEHQLSHEIPKSIERLYEAIANMLPRMEGESPIDMSAAKQQMLLKQFEIADYAFRTYQGYLPVDAEEGVPAIIYYRVRDIGQAFLTQRFNVSEMQVSFDNLRSLLSEIEQLKTPTSDASRHLANWVFRDSLDVELRSIWDQIKHLDTQEDSDELSEAKRQLRIRIVAIQEKMGLAQQELSQKISQEYNGARTVMNYML